MAEWLKKNLVNLKQKIHHFHQQTNQLPQYPTSKHQEQSSYQQHQYPTSKHQENSTHQLPQYPTSKHQENQTHQLPQYPTSKPQGYLTQAKPHQAQQQILQPTQQPRRNDNNPNESRDSDEDSLGYTENDWDQETINFQLEDRMLDCLQQEKYANSYRESLIYASSLGGKQIKRIVRNPIPQPNPSKDNNQISIQSIIGEQFPQMIRKETQLSDKFVQNNDHFDFGASSQLKNEQTINPKQVNLQPQNNYEAIDVRQQQIALKAENKPDNRLKRNRFEKYMKRAQQLNEQAIKQKDETCQDYIDRVLNLKLNSEEILQQMPKNQPFNTKRRQSLSEEKQQQQGKVIKKQSSISQTSFAVFDQAFPNIMHQISISSISSSNQQKQEENFNLQFQTYTNQAENSNIKSSEKQLPPTLDSAKEIFPSDKSQQTHKMSDHVHSQSAIKVPDHSPTSEDGSKKLSLKPYHILTPPRPHSIQKLTTPEQQKPFIIHSNRSISENDNLTIHKNPFEKPKIIKESPQQVKINFVSSSQNFPPFGSQENLIQVPKSPIAKVVFNYGTQNQSKQNTSNNIKNTPSLFSTPILLVSPLSKPIEPEARQRMRVIYNEPQPEERFPIFLRRLRRINSCYPNLWVKGVNHQKVNSDINSILKALQSALSVIELLYKKLCIQKTKLNEPFTKMQQLKALTQKQTDYKKQLQQEIMVFFMTSKWQACKIEQIQYIKPKQRFQRRRFEAKKFDQVIDSYKKFVDHYFDQSEMQLTATQQIKRYYRIRQKISTIVQNLRVISEDLYTFWLIDCNYPELYYDLLLFLKLNPQDNPNKYRLVCDQIYAKILLSQELHDPLTQSIVGQTVLQTIQTAYQSSSQ